MLALLLSNSFKLQISKKSASSLIPGKFNDCVGIFQSFVGEVYNDHDKLGALQMTPMHSSS